MKWQIRSCTNSLENYTRIDQNRQSLYPFSDQNGKKIHWKPSSGRSQENEMLKRLIYKQFVQVSCLCGPQFLIYLPKRFTHLCRAWYGDAILVYRSWCTNMAAGNQQKHIEFTFSIKALSFHSRTVAYKRINISSKTWNGYTAENQEERLSFIDWQNSYFGVTHCENSEVQIAAFSKWNMLREWKLVQRFFFVYLQPSVNKNS